MMEIGDKVKFKFGKKKEIKEGKIIKLFPKNVFLEVDFGENKGKILKRKRHELE